MRNSLHTRFVLGCVVFVFLISEIVITIGQAQRADGQQRSEKVVVNTGEVLLDAVVRDKTGRLVKDLTAADFEVYEDGVKQQTNSIRLVSIANGGTTGREDQQSKRAEAGNRAKDSVLSKGSVAATGVPGISAIALVFDRLSPEARPRAMQAALSYLQESTDTHELFGVFVTDLSMVVLQPFTYDRDLVKSGIEQAGVHTSSLYTSTNEEARSTRQVLTNSLYKSQSAARPIRGVPSSTTAPSLTQEAAMASLNLGILERAEEDQRNQLGDATARGLLHIASSLRALPGRKAVIFFSEGLILPNSVMENFRAIINTANSNNVSFYTVDAAGLRVESKTLETTREIESRSEFRMAQLGSNADSDGPMTKGMERNEDLLRLNPDSGLGLLANQTGGFLITDSNDLRNKLRQVDEDLHAYYLMSYTPNNLNYDGHFRKIEVKVKRSGVTVQSRTGYFAIKSGFASPVLAYEAPVLAALENTPKADSFPFFARGLSFPERERVGFTPVLVDVPLLAFTFRVDKEKRVYETDFTIVALIKDQARQVIRKLSNQYRLSGPLDKLEERKQGRVLFYREADLPPGRYTLETIAYDAPSSRASVRTQTIDVSETDESRLRLSDVVILNGAEPATAVEKRSNPFRVDNVIVSPNLGEPIRRSLKQMPFFVSVYTPTGAGIRPKITVELRKEGRTIAPMPGELLEADAAGRIQYLAALPLEKIPAGSYELRVTVSDGTTSLLRSAYFTIED